jgi:hypothetical protein
MTITEERAKNVLFTEPYYHGGIAAVIKDYGAEKHKKKEFVCHKKEDNPRDGNDLSHAVGGSDDRNYRRDVTSGNIFPRLQFNVCLYYGMPLPRGKPTNWIMSLRHIQQR